MKEHSKSIALAVLGVVLLGMTIAYAALQTNLSIGGTISSPQVSWDVHITNWSQSSTTGSPVITDPTITNTSISGLGVSLPKPGDSVTYTFKIKNYGSIDAKLNAAPTGGFTCTGGKDCSDVTYTLNCGAAASTANTILYADNAGDTDEVSCTLTISRAAATATGANQTYTSHDGAGTFSQTWTYVQN